MAVFGYIGLGMMGAAMAERLGATGADVVVHDLDPTAVARLAGSGARGLPSAAAVGIEADVVSICVPADDDVDAVLGGPGGLVEAGRDTPIVIHSTVHPRTILGAAAEASRWGAPVFDACVAGGADAARRGELAVFVGGADEAPAIVDDLIGRIGSARFDAGPLGAGAALKISVNVMTYAQFGAAAAASEMVAAAGGETTTLLDAWRHIGMLGALTEQFSGLLGIPAQHLAGALREMLNTQVGIAQKDLGLAEELGGAAGVGREFIGALRDAMPEVYGVADSAP